MNILLEKFRAAAGQLFRPDHHWQQKTPWRRWHQVPHETQLHQGLRSPLRVSRWV